jgi:O-antigen ligase/Flp pilus assembly protein TadD
MVVAKKVLWRHSKMDYAMGIFVISQILSTLLSMHPRTSWFGYYTRFNGGLLSTLSFITLFYALINNLQRKHLALLGRSLVLATFLLSIYAIPEKMGHSPSCFLLTRQFNTECWTENNNPRDRVFATFGQPNWLAAFLVGVLPLIVMYFLQEKKTVGQIYLLTVFASAIIALLFTGSRSAFLALLASGPFFALIWWRQRQNKTSVNTWKFMSLGFLSMLLLMFFGGSITAQLSAIFHKQIQRVTPIAVEDTLKSEDAPSQPSTGGTPSDEIRQVVWQGAIKIWQRYPIFGSGVETFAYSYYLDRPATHNLLSEWDFLYNKAHNELLNFLANSGLFGLLSYLLIFVVAAYTTFRIVRQKTYQVEALSFAAAISALFISHIFGFSTVTSNLLLFIYLACLIIYDLDEKKLTYSNDKIRFFEYILFSIIGVFTIATISRTINVYRADYWFTKGQSLFQQQQYAKALQLIEKAIEIAPNEALFQDEVSQHYGQLAVLAAQQNQEQKAQEWLQTALFYSQQALKLNPHHLNFYKSQARLYIRLGQLNPEFYQEAKDTLEKAVALSPTDAKIYYNIALISELLGQQEEALSYMQQAVTLKSNYLQARNELARLYIANNELEKAREQLQYNLSYIAPNDVLVAQNLAIVEASISAALNNR